MKSTCGFFDVLRKGRTGINAWTFSNFFSTDLPYFNTICQFRIVPMCTKQSMVKYRNLIYVLNLCGEINMILRRYWSGNDILSLDNSNFPIDVPCEFRGFNVKHWFSHFDKIENVLHFTYILYCRERSKPPESPDVGPYSCTII